MADWGCKESARPTGRKCPSYWMRSGIMGEWLSSLYQHIGRQRRVLLLRNNFSAHICALDDAPPPSNIKVLFSRQMRRRFTSHSTKESSKALSIMVIACTKYISTTSSRRVCFRVTELLRVRKTTRNLRTSRLRLHLMKMSSVGCG